MNMLDYDYIPPNPEGGQHDYSTKLPSAYPPGTPAGLRGEAVRSALQSGRCLAWKHETQDGEDDDSNFNLRSGLLQLNGKGVLDFLNNKLSNSFPPPQSSSPSFTQACLLNSKGRLVDLLSVAYSSEQAFILPSPGHAGAKLFQKLDPFIFPMDQVVLKDISSSTTIFTLASTKLEHVEATVQQQILPKLQEMGVDTSNLQIPSSPSDSAIWDLGDDQMVVMLPCTGLPSCACVGITVAWDQCDSVASQIWNHLIGNDNPQGPVEIQGLEYETLRIQAGQPAFGHEVTGAWKDPPITSPSPLELHQATVIDFSKGCYQGQEGVSSLMKNPRGPPRTLYSVVFEDDDNIYQHQSEGDDGRVENLTRLPKPGEILYVLGSNEEIQVGTLTSIAEPYSTGKPTIVGLALVRRADSIRQQMKSKELELPLARMQVDESNDGSGIIAPPPMDSLEGLEVVVGGTFTVGKLQGVPNRRFPKGTNMFVDHASAILTRDQLLEQGFMDVEFSGKSPAEFLEEKRDELEQESNNAAAEETLEAPTRESNNNGADADAAEAEAEAQRKTAKMELLQQRAAEAMARRKQKKEEAAAATTAANKKDDSEEAVAAEAKRKAEKMKLLQQKAEEAIARRRQKKQAQKD